MRISDWSSDVCSSDLAKSWARVYNSDPYDRLRSWTNFNLSLRVDGPEDLTFEAYVKNVFNSTPITDSFLNSEDTSLKIGRASGRERVCQYGWLSVVAVALKKQKKIKEPDEDNGAHRHITSEQKSTR